MTLAVLRLLGRRAAIGVSADFGLTDSAADVSIGTTWRYLF
jgi:hypothetical protein